MANILIRHADIITLDQSGRRLLDAEIAIQDTMIVAVGEAPLDFVADEVMDARGQIVFPGFFNAHTHSPMVLFRGWMPQLEGDIWLENRDWLASSGLTSDDVYWGAALAACEMIRNGCVGFADQYFFMNRVAEVAARSGLRANLAWSTFGSDRGEVGTDLAGVATFVEEWQGAGDGRVRTSLAPNSPDVCSPMFLARTAAVAERLGVSIHIHLAESLRQVEQAIAQFDMTPVELLNRNSVFDVPVLAAHCVHVSETDREILASRGVAVVHCPTFQARRGQGMTPVADLRASGVLVALGSERPTVSGRFDMLHEERLAALLSSAGSAVSIPEEATLRMATQVAARTMGFSQSGAIAAGWAADLIVIDRSTARMNGGPELLETLMYSSQGADVRDVMVAGKWLMQDRNLLTLDEDRIIFEARRRSEYLGVLRPA